jgi:glycosyltransferase involved in cell wall biosynthesis/peptidoglycan/xylan/chitin deacetylase (PgdA/CDA1 family)
MARARRLLWRLLCALLYGSGIVPFLGRRRRQQNAGTWTILAYHRIGAAPDATGGPDTVDPGRFLAHLRYLCRRYTVVTIGEALERLREGRMPDRPLLSITFDDGYRDNVTTALPLLVEAGCKATLYVTLEAVREGLPPWTHRLEADLLRLLGSPGGSRTHAGDPLHESLAALLRDAPARRGAARRAVAGLIDRARSLPDPERQAICRQAAALAGDDPGAAAGTRNAAGPPAPTAAMVRGDDLRAWQEAGMEIGSHTVSHPILSRLAAEDCGRELIESRQGLEQLLGQPVRHLAYPNGRHGDWNAAVIEAAKSAGYDSAVTTVDGVNEPWADRFTLRRICVGDESLPAFATRVSGLMTGLILRLRGGRRPAAAPIQLAATSARARPGGGEEDRPLRIAFIGGRGVGGAYSGIERYYEEIGSRLAANGHRVLVYCRSHFSPRARTYLGMELRRLPTIRSKHLETLIHSLLATIDVCFRRVDIVQYHALGSSPFAWLPRLFGKRTIVSVRGLDWQRAKWGWLARAYLRWCEWTSVACPDTTVVVSKTLQAHYRNVHGRAVHYIPNGVGRPELPEPDQIRRWDLGHRDYLLYAGRLSPEKGLEELLEAHRAVAGVCRLVLAGGSSYSEPYMKELQKRAGPGVIFTGFQTGRTLKELYANALGFVLPSHMEGLSVALLEAVASGLPVMTSDIPENREVVDACGGYLFRLNDVDSLRETLRRVIADRQEALRVGGLSRQRALEQFDWERIGERTERLYCELLDRPFDRPSGRREATAA